MKRIAAFVALALVASSADLAAQTFPSRTITLVNPYAAGGPADLLARTVAEGMSAALGQSVIVENRVGAGTAIGAAYVAHAHPDGYTLFIGGSPSHIIAPAIAKSARFDGIKDFSFIAMVGNVPNVLVVPAQRPYGSVPELIAAARAANGAMNFASVGQGSLPQLLGLKLQQAGGFKLVHVPYGGAAPALVDLLAGRIDLAFLNLPPLLPHIQDGTLRALAIANEARSDVAAAGGHDGRAGICRLRAEHLVRHLGSGRHAARHRGQARRGDRRGAQVAGRTGQDFQGGRRGVLERPGRLRGLCPPGRDAPAAADRKRRAAGELD